jgi:hypothetical protein
MKTGRSIVVAALSAALMFSATASAAQPTDIVGGWRLTNSPGVSTIVSFLANGIYFHVEDQMSPAFDPSGQNGMERGTFSWNSVSGAFSSVTLVDTNGQWGLSHPQGPLTVSLSGNLLTLTDFGGAYVFERVVSSTNAIVGSWRLTNSPGVSTIVSFLANGTYFHAEDQMSPAFDPSGQNGMERGTFSWNSVSGAFSSVTLVDTNGQWGLSHPQGALTVSVSGNLLTLTDFGGAYVFERVAPIPEPESYAMLLAGMAMLAFVARRRKQST